MDRNRYSVFILILIDMDRNRYSVFILIIYDKFIKRFLYAL